MTPPTGSTRPSTQAWVVDLTVSPSMPPLAWVARIRAPNVHIWCGDLVRRIGGGVFEGTWVGGAGASGILESTTTFGSGVIVDRERLVLIPPSHMLEAVYTCRRAGELFATNSFVGLLAAAGLRLGPTVDYPAVFAKSTEGFFRFEVPTLDEPIVVLMYEPLHLAVGGATVDVARARETPFADFHDYRARLKAALQSALANAPGFEPLATISSGYDSATVATLASELGCRRAITIADGKPGRRGEGTDDSGESVGRKLGMDVASYRRLTYMDRTDLIEADFLATGMTGEDVVLSAAESSLHNSLLLTGYLGDSMWWINRARRPLLWRFDQTGSSHGEYRVRMGYVHVPLPWFGAVQMHSVEQIGRSPEMKPWALGIANDRPIPRRILEEAGIPRGSFATAKRAPSASIHTHGPEAVSDAARRSLAAFAAQEGRVVEFSRRPLPAWQRGLLKVIKRLHIWRVYYWAEGPRLKGQRHQPVFGNLLLRWAVSVVAPRYRDVSDG